MYCKFCGNEIPDDSKFCKVCGKPIGDSSDVNDKNMQHNNAEDDNNIDRAILKNKNGEPYINPKTGEPYTYNPQTDTVVCDSKTGEPLFMPRSGNPIIMHKMTEEEQENIIRQEEKKKPFILKILTAILRVIAVPVLLIVKFLKFVAKFLTLLTQLGRWVFNVVAFLVGILTLIFLFAVCCMEGGWANWVMTIMLMIFTLLIYAVPKVIAYVYVGLEIARIFLHNFIWPKHKITLQDEVVI